MCCSPQQLGLDSRLGGGVSKSPFSTLNLSNAVLGLPLKLKEPRLPDSIVSGSVNTEAEESNARQRVGFKLLRALRESVEPVLLKFTSEMKLIRAFGNNQFDKTLNQTLFYNLTLKVRNLHYLAAVSRLLAAWLVHDVAPDVMVRTNRSIQRHSDIGEPLLKKKEYLSQLDFDLWRCRDLTKLVVRLLAVAQDFSIALHKHADQLTAELTFFKNYLDSTSVLPLEVERELYLEEAKVSTSLSKIMEEDSAPLPGEERPLSGKCKQQQFREVLQELLVFLSCRDPVLRAIGKAVHALPLTAEPGTKEKAGAYIEGVLWLLHATANRYSGRFNKEIANVVKAGVGCASILYHAELLPEPNFRMSVLEDRQASRVAGLEKWRGLLQGVQDATSLVHLDMARMEEMAPPSGPPSPPGPAIYSGGAALRESDHRGGPASPFLDLSEELKRTTPTYSQGEVVDPSKYEERLTVKSSEIPPRPGSLQKKRKNSDNLEAQFNKQGARGMPGSPQVLQQRDEEAGRWDFMREGEPIHKPDYKHLAVFLSSRLRGLL